MIQDARSHEIKIYLHKIKVGFVTNENLLWIKFNSGPYKSSVKISSYETESKPQ
jgi:hypothetical protein